MDKSVLKNTCPIYFTGPRRQSCDQYKQAKILPHIKEEFHFRVENRLMVEKIIHPRRDKTIVNSLANTSTRGFSRKKKRNRDHTSIDHRRNIAVSGFIKRQIRPQTCQIQSQIVPHSHLSAEASKEKKHFDQKQCLNNLQERFQATNDSAKCRWLTTDSNFFREGSAGKIFKNMLGRGNKTPYTTNSVGKAQNSVTLPCETQKQEKQREEKGVILNQYVKIVPSNIKKLERRALCQHFYNKENLFQSENY